MNPMYAVVLAALALPWVACRQAEPPEAPATREATARPDASRSAPATTTLAATRAPSHATTTNVVAVVAPAPVATTPPVAADGGDPAASAAAPPPASPGFEPASLELLVDCNRATIDYGLGFRAKRYDVTPGEGLDRVLSAISRAASAQSALVVGAAPTRYCGYADRIVCPSDPPEPGGAPWREVCRPFDEDGSFGGLGALLHQIISERGLGHGFGAVLTHGLATRGHATQASVNLGELPYRELGKAIAKGDISVAAIVLEDVPYRRGSLNGAKLKRTGSQPLAPLALVVWGPDDNLMLDLLDALMDELRPFSPTAVRLAGFEATRDAPVLARVGVEATRRPPRSAKMPAIVAGRCTGSEARSSSCRVPLSGARSGLHPERDVLAVTLQTEAPQAPRWGAATWRPTPDATRLVVTTSAQAGDASAPWFEVSAVAGPGGTEEPDAASALPDLYLGRISPVAPCAEAIARLRDAVDPPSDEAALASTGDWTRRTLIPVRCLITNVAARGKHPAPTTASRLRLALAAEVQPRSARDTRTALVRLMDAAGMPEGDTPEHAGVAELRQALVVLAVVAATQQPIGSQRLDLATIDVGLE